MDTAKAQGVTVEVRVKPSKYVVKLESPGTLLQNMPPILWCWGVCVCVCVWGVTLSHQWNWLLLAQPRVSNVL